MLRIETTWIMQRMFPTSIDDGIIVTYFTQCLSWELSKSNGFIEEYFKFRNLQNMETTSSLESKKIINNYMGLSCAKRSQIWSFC